MELIRAKNILTKVKQGDYWFGLDYNMNLYRGCSHRCIYCDSRSACYQITDFSRVRGKRKALTILEGELAAKRKKGVVGLGAMSDTYNPFEAREEMTRGALALLQRYHFGASITTKSDLLLRDKDLLYALNRHNPVIVKLTITTADTALAAKIEPGAPSPTRRFTALEKLAADDIFAGVLLMPVLPFLTDNEENIEEIIRLTAAHGGKFIYAFMGMTLRDRQREYYYNALDRQFPGKAAQYREAFAEQYRCFSPRHSSLYRFFAAQCEKAGLLWRMDDIIAAYKGSGEKGKVDEQLSLF